MPSKFRRTKLGIPPVVTPPVAVTVTFVVADPGSLTAGDIVLRDRMTGRGWTVTTVAASAAEDTTVRTLTVISESVSSGDIGSKYSTRTQGVVLTEAFVADSWNLVTVDPGAIVTTQSVRINTSHAAAAGLSIGSHTIATAGDIARFANATVASSADKFMTDDATPTNVTGFAVEAGASILNGNTAAGRRVVLGWQGSLAAALNATGLSLFDAACDWARGTFTPPTPPTGATALLIVNSATMAAADNTIFNRLGTLGYSVQVRTVADAEDTATYSIVVISPTCINLFGKYRMTMNPVLNLNGASWAWWYLVEAQATVEETADGNGYVHSGHALAGGLSTAWYALSNNSGLANQQFRVPNSVGGQVPAAATIYLTHSTDVDDWPIGFGVTTGAAIFGGNVTQNRRVCLGWMPFLFETGLVANAWTLFEAAVTWLAGSAPVAPAAPGAPGTPTATPGNTQVSLTATPAAANGSSVTGYRWYAYTAAGTDPYAQQDSTGPSHTFTGLVNGTGVRFKVDAINGVGRGPLSGFSATVTPLVTTPASSFSPTIIPLSDPEFVNTYRGQYEWIVEDDLKPSWWPWIDSYDRLGWWQLENGEGNYDFTDIERRLQRAATRKGRHWVAVMSALSYDYGSYIWHHGNYVPSFNGGVQVPQYIRNAIGGWQRGSAWFPDWNHPYYLARWEALMMALGNAYRNDPRFAGIDIRGYGDFGEWHIYGLEDSVGTLSYENGFRLVDATVNAFRAGPGQPLTKYCNMLTPVDSALRYAVGLDPKVGVRADCLGSSLGPSVGYSEPDTHPARQKWMTAPYMTEWCGIPDPNTQYWYARQHVETYHISGFSGGNIEADYGQPNIGLYEEAIKKSGYRFELRQVQVGAGVRGNTWSVQTRWGNIGVAPAYDPWAVRYELRSGSTVVASWDSVADLRTILPGETTVQDAFLIPSGISAGSYTLAVRVQDPTNYLNPMRLANTGRQSDGRHDLGTVSIT